MNETNQPPSEAEATIDSRVRQRLAEDLLVLQEFISESERETLCTAYWGVIFRGRLSAEVQSMLVTQFQEVVQTKRLNQLQFAQLFDVSVRALRRAAVMRTSLIDASLPGWAAAAVAKGMDEVPIVPADQLKDFDWAAYEWEVEPEPTLQIQVQLLKEEAEITDQCRERFQEGYAAIYPGASEKLTQAFAELALHALMEQHGVSEMARTQQQLCSDNQLEYQPAKQWKLYQSTVRHAEMMRQGFDEERIKLYRSTIRAATRSEAERIVLRMYELNYLRWSTSDLQVQAAIGADLDLLNAQLDPLRDSFPEREPVRSAG